MGLPLRVYNDNHALLVIAKPDYRGLRGVSLKSVKPYLRLLTMIVLSMN